MTEEKIKMIFEKDLGIYSNFWLLIIGVLIGAFSTPFLQSVQLEFNILGIGIVSLTIGSSIVAISVTYLLIHIAWYVAQNRNPFRIRDKLLKEYLEAKEELRLKNRFLTDPDSNQNDRIVANV